MSGLERIARAIDLMNDWIGRSLAWLTLGMVLVTFVVVLLRYVFGIGWTILQESIVYMHAIVFMGCAGFALVHNGHVRCDIFYSVASPRGKAVIDIVGPMLRRALSIPFEIVHANVEDFLSTEPAILYDTIFLDTWDTLDAKYLPHVNRLRDLALRHLAPEGRVLLWGYRWMVRLFEDACRQLLNLPPDKREIWLAQFSQPEATALLQPIVAKFVGEKIEDMDAALAWSRAYIVARVT